MKVAKLAEEECDRTTLSFIDWFIDEQVEEEQTVRDIIKRLELFGEDQGFALPYGQRIRRKAIVEKGLI